MRLRRHYHADDAVQSVYRALCAALLVVNENRQFRHRGALLNYLLKILRIRIATAGRKAQFESLSDGQDLVSEEPCDLTDAKDLVTTVLERFTERDQRLILLYGELSSETAVARAMGCSRSTVRRVLERFAILTRRLSGHSAIAGKGGGPCRVGKPAAGSPPVALHDPGKKKTDNRPFAAYTYLCGGDGGTPAPAVVADFPVPEDNGERVASGRGDWHHAAKENAR